MSDNKNLGHIMIDLETLDTKPTAVITAIAAVEFDIETGDIGRTYYKRIDIQSCLEFGRTISAETIKFWFEQSKEAQIELFREPENLALVIHDFRRFLSQFKTFPCIWSNGIGFDLAILKDVFNSKFVNVEPWHYSQERDVRTIVSLNPTIKGQTPNSSVEHNALNDCFHQINYLHLTYKSIQINDVIKSRL